MKRKNPAAASLGRKGGKNSRKNLTPELRRELAQKAAAARWARPIDQSGTIAAEPIGRPVKSGLARTSIKRKQAKQVAPGAVSDR